MMTMHLPAALAAHNLLHLRGDATSLQVPKANVRIRAIPRSVYIIVGA